MKSSLLLISFLYCFFCFSQNVPYVNQTGNVDFKNIDAEVNIFPKLKKVEGSVNYSFDILAKTDSIFIDAKNMKFANVRLNGKKASFTNNGKRIWITSHFRPSKNNRLALSYSVKPSQTMYFINWNVPDSLEVTKEVWTQGQGRYTSYWLPSFDDMGEKTVFNLKINFNSHYNVIANGKFLGKEKLNDTLTSWKYSMEKPMCSYLVAVAAGNYVSKDLTTSGGVPLHLYYHLRDSLKVEPTYRYSKKIFDFLQSEIGYPYAWQNYKEIPVQDFLYSGMENTSTTIFSNSLMVDSIAYNDRNFVNVNAHELAHQWFGDLVTETSGSDHWLQEGFATYYALLAERELFGDDYYYWKLYQTAEQLKDVSDKGKGQAILSEQGSSLTYYQKGAWALHILREKIGDSAFKAGIKNYLDKYAFKNVSTAEFLAEMEKASGKDLTDFRKNWLEQSAFLATDALKSLKKSAFIKNYLQLAALKEVPLEQKWEQLNKALDFPVNDYLGQEAVHQLSGNDSPSAIQLYKKAFKTGNLYVRQAIAVSMDTIPKELKPDFESLLKDKSYVTIENALLKLWLAYPDETAALLNKTKGINGFLNKNVHMLWLAINLVTPEVDTGKTEEYYKELSNYTHTYWAYEVRENAFGYLYQINAFRDHNLIDLVKGARHPVTRFRNFCRELLDKLLEVPEYNTRFKNLKQDLSPEEWQFLSKRFN